MIHVLMVESEPRNLIGAKTYLEKEGEISLETARSMEEGLKKLKNSRYNIIISAYELQGQDGAAFLRAAKRISPETPMILYSMKCREERLITFLMMETKNIGADFLLVRGETDAARFSQISDRVRAESEKKSRDEQVDHRNNVLLAIKNIGLINTENDEIGNVIRAISSALVESGAYGHAWIVLTSENGRVTGYAGAGIEKDFNLISTVLDKGELPGCVQNALRHAGIIASRDPAASCPECPLSPAYRGLGAMTLALRHGDKVYGAISVSLGSDLIVDEGEQDLFEEVGVAVSSVINRMDADRERIRTRRQVSAQQQLGRKLAEAETLDEVIGCVVESSVSASDMDCGALYLVDDTNGGFTLAASLGLSEDYSKRYSHYPPESGLAVSIHAKKTTYSWFGSVELHMLGITEDAGEGLKAVALVPILYRDRVIGSLHVASHTRDDVPPVCRDAFETIAAQAANAIIRIRAERINPSIELLRDLNRLTRTAGDASEMADQFCRRISGGPVFSGAMVAILENDHPLLSYQYGGEGIFEEVVRNLKNGQIPQDAKESLSSGEPAESIKEDGSVIYTAMSEISEDRNLILSVSVGKSYDLDIGATGIFREIIDEISYALGACLTRKELEYTSEKLRERDELLGMEKILKEKSESLMPSLFCAIGTDGIILRSNSVFSRSTGKSPDEIRGQLFAGFFPEEYREGIKKHLVHISEKGGVEHEVSFNVPLITASGEELPVEWTCTVVRSYSGTAPQILCSGRDLSEIKKAEEQYNEVFARYTGTISSVEEGIVISDLSGTIISMNPAAEAITGWSSEDAAGHNTVELIRLTDEQTGKDLVLQGDDKKEGLLRSKNGAIRQAEISHNTVKDGKGIIIGYLTVIRDISGKKEASEAISRLDAIFETVGPVVLTDLNGTVEYWNSDAERITGRTAVEMTGADLSVCIPEHERTEIEKILSKSSESNNTAPFRAHILSANGREIPVMARGAPLFDPNGNPTGAAISFLDLSGEIIEKERAKELERKFTLLRDVARCTCIQAEREDIATSVCGLLVSTGWFEDAWIVLVGSGENDKTIRMVAPDKIPAPHPDEKTPCTRRALEFNGPVTTRHGSAICEECPLSGDHINGNTITIQLSFSGEAYGILGVSGREDMIGDRGIKSLLTEISEMVSHSLSSVATGKSLDRITLQTSAQHRLSERLANATTVQKVVSAILESAINTSSGTAGAVYMYAQENDSFLLYDATPREVLLQSPAEFTTDSEPGLSLISGEPLLIKNIQDSDSGLLGGKCLMSIAIPVVHMNRLNGSLIIGLDSEVQPDEQLVRMLESIAAFGASAIHRIRTEQAEPIRETAAEINRILRTTDEPGALPGMITRRLCETPGIMGASMSLAGETEGAQAICGDLPGEISEGERETFTKTLSFSGKNLGTISIHIDAEYASNPEIAVEFDHICDDISFALHSAANTREKERALKKISGDLEELESELRKLERAEGLSQLLSAEINPDRSVRKINDYLASLKGLEEGEIEGSTFEALFITEEERETAAGCLSALSESGEKSGIGTFNAWMPLPSGERRWIEWNCAIADESPVIICSGRDLTESREAEEKAERLFAGYMGTLSAVDDGVIISDRNDRIVMINRPAEIMTAWSAQEAKGKELAEVLSPVDEDSGAVLDITVLESAECILRARDGTDRFAEISKQEACDDSGRIHGYVTVVRDMSGKRLEKEGGLKLEAVIGAAGAVAITGISGIIKDLNGEAGMLAGIEAGEWIGREIGELFLTETPGEIEELLRRTADSGKAVSLETRIAGKLDETRWVRLRVSPLRDEGGEITGFAIGFTEISDEVSSRDNKERKERNLSLLKKAKDVATQSSNSRDLIDAVCDLFSSGMHDGRTVALLSGEGEVGYAAGDGVPDALGTEIPGCLARALRFGGRIVTSSPSPICEECPFSILHDGTDVFAIRLEHGDRVFGVLAVPASRGVWDDPGEEEAVFDVSGIVSLALSGLQAKEEHIFSAREASSQKELAERLSVINSPGKAAAAVTKVITGPLAMDCAIVYLYDNQGKIFRSASHRLPDTEPEPAKEINAVSDAGRMIMSGKTSCSGDSRPDEEIKNMIFGTYAEKLKFCAIVPMIYKNSVIGALISGTEEKPATTGQVCGILESISSYGASSIQRIRAEQVSELIRAGEKIGRIQGTGEPAGILDKACAILSDTGVVRDASYSPEILPDETPGQNVLQFSLEAGGNQYGTLVVVTEDEYADNPEIGEVMGIIVQDIADLLHTSRVTAEMEVIARDLKDSSAALESEKSRMEITGNIVSSYLAELDTDGRIGWINDSLGDAIGAATDELQGRDFSDVFEHGEDAVIIRDTIRNIADGETESGKSVFGSSFRSRDGTIRTVEWTCSAVKDRSGAISGILCSGEDLSDLMQADDRFSLLSSRLTGIMESLDEAVILVDDKGIIVFMNARAEDMAGIPYSSGAGERFVDCVRLMDGQVGDAIDLTLDTGDVSGVLIRSDGTERYVRARARTIRKDNGTVSARVIVIRDITPEKETGEEIKKMEALLKSSGEPIAEISGEGTITGWNEFAEEETGYTASGIVGTKLSDLVPEEIREEAREEILNLLSGETEGSIDTIISYSDGTAVNVEITLSPLEGESELKGATARWRNITGEKIEKRRLFRINKILETIVAVQKASIGRHESPGGFCEECCNALTETGGARTAVISLTGNGYEGLYYSGPSEWSPAIMGRIGSGELPEFLEIAMEHPGVVDLDDIGSASKDEDINRALRGKRVLAMRLEENGDIYGYLFVSVMKTDTFPDDHDWFERIADAVSSGLSRIIAGKESGHDDTAFPELTTGLEDLEDLIPENVETDIYDLHSPQADELRQEISALLSVIEKPAIITDENGKIIDEGISMKNLYSEINLKGTSPEDIMELFPGHEDGIADCLLSVFMVGESTLSVEIITGENEIKNYIIDFRKISDSRCLVTICQESRQQGDDIPEDIDGIISSMEDYLKSFDKEFSEEEIPLTETVPERSIEEALPSILSVIGGLAAITDGEGRIIRANRPLAELGGHLGLIMDDANIDSIVDQAAGESIISIISRSLTEDTTEAVAENLHIISIDGNYREAHVRASCIPESGSCLVVAEYVKTDEEPATRETAEEKTEYPEIPGTAVVVIDDDGRVIMTNPGMEKISGFAQSGPGEGETTIHELIDPSKSAIITEYINMMDENPDVPPIIRDFQFEDANGNTIECDIAISKDREKGITVLSFTDISEYARSIRELEGRLRQMEDSAGSGNNEVVGIRCKDKFIYMNSAGLKFFGVGSLIDLSHKPIIEYVHPDYREESIERTRMSYVDKKPTSFVYMEFIRDDGTVVHGETATVPLYYGVEPASLMVIKNTGIGGNPETEE